MRSWLLCGLLAVCLAALSGCSALEGLGGASEKSPPPPKPKVVVREAPDIVTKIPAKPVPPVDNTPRPKRKPDMLDPKTLVGLDKAAVSALFGEPYQVATSQLALVWMWKTDDCEMRVFFYPDVADKKFKALAYEIHVLNPKNKAVVLDTCASRLKWAHAEATR